MALSKQEILATRQSGNQVKAVTVPGWGECFLRRMSGGDRDEWDLWQIANSYSEEDEKAGKGREGLTKLGTRTVRAKFATLVLSDADGQPLFTADDVPAVAELDGEALSSVWEQGRLFNGIGQQAAEAIRKNSKEAPSGDGGSASPESSASP